MTISKRTQIKGLSVILLITIIPLIISILPSSYVDIDNSVKSDKTQGLNNLQRYLWHRRKEKERVTRI